eukprot:365276-Chlamydomonas_euryale.AAC.6
MFHHCPMMSLWACTIADNYIETIHGSFDFEVNAPYLMYTHGNSETAIRLFAVHAALPIFPACCITHLSSMLHYPSFQHAALPIFPASCITHLSSMLHYPSFQHASIHQRYRPPPGTTTLTLPPA